MGDVLPVSVTVILPTRNEEEALGPTIDAIPGMVQGPRDHDR